MKIRQEVLQALSTAHCDGDSLVLTGQLDRSLYVATNKVLEALGGKWNRKVKAHIFDGDAQSLIDAAIVKGEVTTNRDIGFFPTPQTLARELVDIIEPGMVVLEPSAGEGAIVEAIIAAGATPRIVELDAKRRETLVRRFPGIYLYVETDFLDVSDTRRNIDAVVMNPPFTKSGKGDHIDHVRHAFNLVRPGGVVRSVMPSSVSFREDRRHTDFRQWVLAHGTIVDLPPLSFRASGTDVNTCVVTVRKP